MVMGAKIKAINKTDKILALLEPLFQWKGIDLKEKEEKNKQERRKISKSDTVEAYALNYTRVLWH